MSHKKLTKAPLQEVVLELRWEGQIDNANHYDEGYDLAVGKFHHSVSEMFPVHKKIYQDGITVFGLPMHQYWKGEQKWPVVQHGPCILAINDIEENYIWAETFKPMIFDCTKKLKESYGKPLKFNQLSLQYVDVFEKLANLPQFIIDNLNIQGDSSIEGFSNSNQFSYYKNFCIDQESVIHLSVSTLNATLSKNRFDSLMININFVYSGYFDFESVDSIIETAHNSASLFFKNLLKKEFYASLL